MTVGREDTGKHPEESEAEMIVMMLPSDANPKGNVFGGVILKHVDLILWNSLPFGSSPWKSFNSNSDDGGIESW